MQITYVNIGSRIIVFLIGCSIVIYKWLRATSGYYNFVLFFIISATVLWCWSYNILLTKEIAEPVISLQHQWEKKHEQSDDQSQYLYCVNAQYSRLKLNQEFHL